MFILYISYKFLSTLPPVLLPSEPNLIIYPRNIEFSKVIISLRSHINKSGLVRSKLGHTFRNPKEHHYTTTQSYKQVWTCSIKK